MVYFEKKGEKTIKFASHGPLGIKINKTKKEDKKNMENKLDYIMGDENNNKIKVI